MELRPPTPDEFPALLRLNNDHAVELAPETAEDFARLISVAWRVRVADDAAALCIVFDQDSDHASQNIDWFREHYERFVYVDRVVVAPGARGRGLARRLYTDVMDVARRQDYPVLCAEINLDPPNPASDAFHAAMGFVPVGTARLDGRDKTVRYHVRKL